MAVYVDDMCAEYGRMIMCHMAADSHIELVAMARTIGVSPKHIQDEGTHREHMDICLSKRRLAVQHGALPIRKKWMVQFMNDRKDREAHK